MVSQDNWQSKAKEASERAFRSYRKMVSTDTDREVSAILPVGSGKTGCIVLNPFAFKSKRTLIEGTWVTDSDQILSATSTRIMKTTSTKSAAHILDEERIPQSSRT